MRIYNKRKFFIGIGEFILSIVAFVTMFITRTIDIKFIVVNVIVFTLGIVNISRSLSKSDTAEDIIEENDERNRLISLRINNMRYKILIVVIYISVVSGMLAYGVTRNINIVIALLPLLLLLCICFLSSFILAFYYEKKC
ncbi:MAG: hypothetical protein KH186_01720 [Lachnospiraceae bacterium]|nr:hypothetical protein [Lachnospiraceae bacterium]